MKRVLLTILAFALILAMCFSVAGCSDAKEKLADKKEEIKDKVQDIVDKTAPSTDEEKLVDEFLTTLYDRENMGKIFDYVHPNMIDRKADFSNKTADEYAEWFIDGYKTAFEHRDEEFSEWSVEWAYNSTEDCDEDAYDRIAGEYLECDVEVEDIKAVNLTETLRYTYKDTGSSYDNDRERVAYVVLIDGEWFFEFDSFSDWV